MYNSFTILIRTWTGSLGRILVNDLADSELCLNCKLGNDSFKFQKSKLAELE